MSERYALAAIAQDEFEEIILTIAEDSIEDAVRVEGEFHDLFARLAERPLFLGHTRRGISGAYRVAHLYKYLVIYKPGTAPLQIMRVRHGHRRIPRNIEP